MKILYKTMGLGLLSACLYLLCAAPASAKVCFVGDENCGAGGSFEPAEKLPNEDLCRQEGYTSLASTCLNPGGTCPYDAKYVKCCGSEYAYQACVFPLETIKVQNSEGKEVTDKCGNLYKCRCNSEYKTPADWSDEASNKCQPGGGVCIMSTTDTVYYNKCTCDGNYFPYEKSCPKNTTEIDSCTDSDGLTRKSCQCPNTYKTCTYGGAPGADTCIQNGITLYSSCNTPEQECINAGYYENCSKQRCYYDTQNMEKNKSTYPIACENSNDVCPYMFGYYFCRWSPLNFCKAKHAEMNIESPENPPSTCVNYEGVKGTVIPCKIDYDGEGKRMYKNTTDPTKYLGYYRCKITCDQRLLSKVGTAVTADERFGQYKGAWNAFYITLTSPKNGFKAGTHLFLRSDFKMPQAGLSYDNRSNGDKLIYAKGQSSQKMYASINGIGALYKLDPSTYSECDEEYNDTGKNPELRIPLEYANNILSRGFTNIDLRLTYQDDSGKAQQWGGRTFTVKKEDGKSLSTYIWDNIGLIQTHELSLNSHTSNSNDALYDSARTVINQNDGTKIRFTGDVGFNTAVITKESTQYDPLRPSGDETNTSLARLVFHGDGYHIVEFKNAKVSGSTGRAPDFDTNEGAGGTINIDNSTVYAHNIFSFLNVNVNNRSKLYVRRLLASGRHSDYDKNTSGMFKQGKQYCVGTVVRGSSSVDVSHTLVNVWEDRYLYVGGGSTFTSAKPIRLRKAGNSVACIADSSSSISAMGTKYTSSFSFPSDGSYMTLKGSKSGSRRIMYSVSDSACMPTGQSRNFNSSSPYRDHCTGYKSNQYNFAENNPFSDEFTFATPGSFSVYVSYSGSPNTYGKTQTISSWYPKLKSATRKGMLTCNDKGRSAREIDVTTCSSNANTNNCTRDGKNIWCDAESGPRWFTSVVPYYYRCHNSSGYCANSSKYSYGCTGERKFLCSGCSYCENGIGYADWSDSTGGL